jgi:hypothetical protein
VLHALRTVSPLPALRSAFITDWRMASTTPACLLDAEAA